ncbi:MAG: DUF3127 domain-containing protein [Prevotellaceae bacterium]|jgi:hypothetical protein|nr:DUF3127 domain-containing protein [Prevotellaceae bacterium]
MALDIVGKLIQKLEVESGESARGSWSRQDAIFETIEQYPRKVCISFWGERISDLEKIKLGDKVTVSINIDSREGNTGRWFTSVRAWKVQFADENVNPQPITESQTSNIHKEIPAPTASEFIEATEPDDLPF